MKEMCLHTFVICAYKESPYLEECILSLKQQHMSSKIIMATSTPCKYLDMMATKYEIPLFINEGEAGITQDWNYALSKVNTKYATIAHQDDVYEAEYTKSMVTFLEKEDNPIIAFSHYSEIRNGEKVYKTTMLNIKKMMLFPLKNHLFWKSRFVRRRVLSLGDPICCPSVCFSMDNVQQPVFENHYRSCEDWEAWEKLSKQKGAFIYIPKPLMSHRIHEDSTTTEIIKDCGRIQENYEMYCKFWPKWFAGCINHFYTKSENSNELKGTEK